MISKSPVVDGSPAATASTCPVCERGIGASEIYFRAVVNGQEALLCPRCLSMLVQGIDLLEAQARLKITFHHGGGC